MVVIKVIVSKSTINKICEVEKKLNLRIGPVDELISTMADIILRWNRERISFGIISYFLGPVAPLTLNIPCFSR